MSVPCAEPPTVLEPPASSAELCLYLIMILPDIDTRRLHIKDFCRLYEIREKREESRLSALTKQPLRGEP
jgi:hypothetical protein